MPPNPNVLYFIFFTASFACGKVVRRRMSYGVCMNYAACGQEFLKTEERAGACDMYMERVLVTKALMKYFHHH